MKASDIIDRLSAKYGWRSRPLNSTSEAVDYLTDLIPNVALIGVRKGTKRANMKEWQKVGKANMADPKYVGRLRGASGLAANLGEPSGDLISIDIDHDEMVKPFFEANPLLSKSLITRGKRGCNVFLRMRGDYLDRIKTIPDFGEWRAGGGYTVVYGQHPEPGVGNYDIVNDAPPVEIEVGSLLLPNSLSVPSTFLHNLHHLGNLHYLHGTPRQDVGGAKEEEPLEEERAEISVSSSAKALLAESEFNCDQPPKVVEIYDRYVRNRISPRTGERNDLVVAMVTFLAHAVSPELVLLFCRQVYLENGNLWRDPLERHKLEALAHLKSVLQSYGDDLSEEEAQVYRSLDPDRQAAFRICRDLALREDKEITQGRFFLSCGELAARLGKGQKEAHRILRRFEDVGIIKCYRRGTRRKKGQRGVATTFDWCLPVPTNQSQPQSDKT